MDIQISTGNQIVDAVGRMNFSGNIVPDIWYKTITKDGKPHLLAINILADIVYWYRPAEKRDEYSNNISYKKKFDADDFVQRSYKHICEKFNVSDKQVRTALEVLEGLDVIKRHFRTQDTQYGTQYNVMYLELKPETLERLTFPKDESDDTPKRESIPTKSDFNSHEEKTISPKEESIYTEGNTYFPPGKYPLSDRETPISPEDNTNTKNTTEISTEITTTTEDVKKLLNPIALDDRDIKKIISTASGSFDKVEAAINCLKSSGSKINNVTGFLISAITNNYKPTPYQPIRKNSFNDFSQREIDYSELERILTTT